MPKGYSSTQIALHWIVALLVLVQFLNTDAIGAAWHAVRRGLDVVPGGLLVTAHVIGGIAILTFAIWRIALRLTRGAPPPPADDPRTLRYAAAATHGLLYLLLLLVPLSGLAAWFGGVAPAGEAHEILKTLLLVVVLLHIAGALYQRFVLRSEVLQRMVRANH